MIDLARVLNKKSLVVVFAYVPAGLGHLRVTDAFFHGLPKGITPLLLGSEDNLTMFFHRLTSVNPLAKHILEWSQNGFPEDLFTKFYHWLYCHNNQTIYRELNMVLAQRMDLPKTVLVIATHFGLAHQIIAVKNKLEREKHVKIIVVMQVTDDSPQHFWYVPGVDLIVVPSEKTRQGLIAYGEEENLKAVDIKVLPYPIDPFMEERLSDDQYQNRLSQLNFKSKSPIHMAIPVSGAAVGMDFITHMVDALHEKSDRFIFNIISKSTPYTQGFLNDMINRDFIKLNVSFSSREIVDKYASLYKDNVISLEITKPSEQSFKALFYPNQKGGSVLFFSEHIGRQEEDNLDFLRRHRLIPLKSEMDQMWEYSERGVELDGEGKWILEKAKHWRGLILPFRCAKAANFILWCLHQGILEIMIRDYTKPKDEGNELGSDGVMQFWQKVAELVIDKS